MLLNRPLRPSTGYTHIYTNAGHNRNSGFEFAFLSNDTLTGLANFRPTGSTLNNKAIDVGSDIYFSEDVATGDYWNIIH